MDTESNSLDFEPLPMRRRVLSNLDAGTYSIIDVSGETRKIKADTAYEAFKMSGLKNAIKIERLSNMDGNILDKSRFPEEASSLPEGHSSAGKGPGSSLHDRIMKRKNPIITADELDEMMRTLRQEADTLALEPAAQEPEVSAPPGVVPVPAPEPAAAGDAVIAAQEGAPPTGVEVHGDGFDEIIPAAPPAKPLAAKSPETKEMPVSASSQAGSALSPERELSPEEVAKLLDGK